MKCDCCEEREGFTRLNGLYFICDDCNDDYFITRKCECCGKEESCGEMLYADGMFYCDHECFEQTNGHYPSEEEAQYGFADHDAWKIIQNNKAERENRFMEAAE